MVFCDCYHVFFVKLFIYKGIKGFLDGLKSRFDEKKTFNKHRSIRSLKSFSISIDLNKKGFVEIILLFHIINSIA
ncbi:Uncharacterised protein [Chryseobacterium nakagawai]|uniref:Uncharacterized protein n=1 Tax=Chryseobacterium nakagawai TaxID=1241982 RepID=A0AAD0YK26_CHRNA|nr:hypothetical protein EG343_15700 [Chryseobacterium nakagawai]VEH18483.1 Uncharacterised protein [Chryseobacterium nakagawai]